MTAPLHEDLDFHGPLSAARADALIRSFGPLDGAHVVEFGCGWAELLLRTVASAPDATGHGVDLDEVAIGHGRANAAARGLDGRVVLDVGDAARWRPGRADVVIVNGSSHVWGGDPATHTANALTAARALLGPQGRLLLGEGYWEREPSAERLAAMPIKADECRALPDLVDLAHEHGFRLWNLSRASRDEWDAFQSRHALGWERRLLAEPDDDETRRRADEHRTAWLRGWRDLLGFAYLTLRLSGTT